MKERIKELGYWLEDKLKDLCGEITPDKRLTVIIIMLLLFTILNLYFTFTAISNWGKQQERKEQLKIEHIKQLELEKSKFREWDFDYQETEPEIPDSTNNRINKSYGG
ncbi:TraL conjugative transposon family protein [uncultured Dysgonomonas sp.]|uniref:DUF3989 domain-containing protein n=1 Tax=uncultured Dysgonomonas sp. TaxID=206096 RepID=A0A212IT77_9BACT|nr:TraL conjugative transposon family protein [uncultured Dysgonomonas sp.]SBV90413.1 conserved hypothetical protein [uncultured Dysgonomonas sp.]